MAGAAVDERRIAAWYRGARMAGVTQDQFQRFLEQVSAAMPENVRAREKGVSALLEQVTDASDETVQVLSEAGDQLVERARVLATELGGDALGGDDSAALFAAMVAMGHVLTSS